MRIFTILLLTLTLFTITSAQDNTPSHIEIITGLGVGLYYPADMQVDVAAELILYFDNDDRDRIVITPPESLSNVWNITSDDLDRVSNDFYADMQATYPVAQLTNDEFITTTIGGYDALYFELREEAYGVYVYVFAIEDMFYGVRLATRADDPADQLAVLDFLASNMVVLPSLSEDVLPRLAPFNLGDITDMVEETQSVTTPDSTFTFTIPTEWTITTTEVVITLTDSQAVLDAFNSDESQTINGLSFTVISRAFFDELGLTGLSPSEIAVGIHDLVGIDDIQQYVNLPYEAYYVPLEDAQFEQDNHFMIIMSQDVFGDEVVGVVGISSDDFETHEALILAILNTMRLTPSA